MDRFDIPATIKDFFTVAMETRTIDVSDVYSLATKHGNDWHALVDEIIGYAFANRHSNPMNHKRVVQAAELFWQTEPLY